MVVNVTYHPCKLSCCYCRLLHNRNGARTAIMSFLCLSLRYRWRQIDERIRTESEFRPMLCHAVSSLLRLCNGSDLFPVSPPLPISWLLEVLLTQTPQASKGQHTFIFHVALGEPCFSNFTSTARPRNFEVFGVTLQIVRQCRNPARRT